MAERSRFWDEFVCNHEENPERYIVSGTKGYYIGEKDAPKWSKGFGGRIFTITFNNGKVITTDNLWHKGTIPEEYRSVLKPNCTVKEGG